MKRSCPTPVLCLFVALTATAVPRMASAAIPTVSVPWYVGTQSPVLMNNETGFCWLTEIYKSNSESNRTTIALTFDSNWNWVFTGGGDGNSYGVAECLPWKEISRAGTTYGVYYGEIAKAPAGPTTVYMGDTDAESICVTQGWAGNLNYNTIAFVAPGQGGTVEITENEEGTPPWMQVWGSCAKLAGGGPALNPSVFTIQPNIFSDMGPANNQMCWLNEIEGDTNNDSQYTRAELTISQGDYFAYATGIGSIGVSCLPLLVP
jgi:hypothetical protein